MLLSGRKVVRYLSAVILIASLNFAIPRAMPGDPMTNLLGEDVILTERSVAEIRENMGLDLPLHIQFIRYWREILSLDLGYSYHLHSPVLAAIIPRMKWTVMLSIPPMVLGAVLGTYLGALAGWRRAGHRVQTGIALMAYATPPYFLSMIALYALSFRLGLFPLKGFYSTGSPSDIAHHLLLPSLVMTLFSSTRNYMVMRGSVLQERRSLYAAYARAKGLYGDEILFRHIFRNALLPIVTLLAMDFGFILSGTLFIEIVFSMNGMGRLIYDAILSRDYPVLQGAFLVITLMVISANLLADLIYSLLDPRVRWK